MNFLLYVLLFVIFSPKFFMILGGRRAASVTMTDILFHALLFALALYVVGYFTRTYGVFEGFQSLAKVDPIQLLNRIDKYQTDLTDIYRNPPFPAWTTDRAAYTLAINNYYKQREERIANLRNQISNSLALRDDALAWWFYTNFVYREWKTKMSLPKIRQTLIKNKTNVGYWSRFPPTHPFTRAVLINPNQKEEMKSVIDFYIKTLPAK